MATPPLPHSPPFPSLPLLLASLSLLVAFSTSAPLTSSLCDRPLPLPPATIPSSSFPPSFFLISNGAFYGGDPIFSLSRSASSVNSFSLLVTSSFHTDSPGLIRITGTLVLRGIRAPTNQTLYPRHRQHFEIPFHLDGFWSEHDSLLCMHGPGTIDSSQVDVVIHSSAILKLSFSKTSNITSSLVTGTLDSTEEPVKPNYFNPMHLVAFSERKYEYTETSHAKNLCDDLSITEESWGLDGEFSCGQLRRSFQLEFGRDCLNGHCEPSRGALGFNQDYMSPYQIDCSDDGKVHMYLVFTNKTWTLSYNFIMTDKVLVVEGFWDRERNRLCLFGCDVVLSEKGSVRNPYISECSLGLSFWFPSVLSIKNRSVAVGRIWEAKKESNRGNFSMIPLRSAVNAMRNFAKLKYKYTKLEVVRGFCAKVDHGKRTGKGDFPDGKTLSDMSFRFLVKSKEGRGFVGSATPVTLGDNFYASFDVADKATQLFDSGYLNISYNIGYYQGPKKWMEISAEGIYNPKSGTLCLIGCRYVGLTESARLARVNDSMDCEIFVNVQFGSLHGKPTGHAKGSVRSLRAQTDPLFFDSVELNSHGIYIGQAAESIWRMDVETAMALTSSSLTCLFLGLQLHHLKKNPNFRPSISILMLVILVLGNMIPLVLNFDALFQMRRSKKHVLVWNGGWLEANEVIIRLLTMVNLLLWLRLLQVAWAARSADVSGAGLWDHERKTIWICLPLYLFGAIIAWFVHTANKTGTHNTLWEDLSSYAGLILDGFLLPQVIFNVLSDSKDKALARSFYLGLTLVRVLPHTYDAYRSRHYVPLVKSPYYTYANRSEDAHSLVWYVVVPLGVLILSLVVFLQQRFGGGSLFLPLSIRRSVEYEMVPVSNSL